MTVCEKLFIQGRTRSRLLRTDLAVVPDNGLIGSKGNANTTQLQSKVFIYINIIPFKPFCRAGCEVPGAFKQDKETVPFYFDCSFNIMYLIYLALA